MVDENERIAQNQRKYKQKKIREGYKRLSVWIKKDWEAKLKELLTKWHTAENKRQIAEQMRDLKEKYKSLKNKGD